MASLMGTGGGYVSTGGGEIRHDYGINAVAISGLVRLSHRIAACDFETAFQSPESAGATRSKLDETLAELNAVKQTMAEIVDKTRQVLRNADASFARADAEAEAMFRN
jgi:uncharacterized protein YukE